MTHSDKKNIQTRETLAEDYRNLGLQKGDVVLMRAALNAIGRVKLETKLDHIHAVLDVIGPEGTLVGLSFTKSYATFFNPPKAAVFTKDTPAITGAFANLMLHHPDAVRSRHPTNFYVAIGAKAHDILDDHDHTKHTYYPIEKLLDLNAKMILVGCIDDSPGFTTAHLAEYRLGLLKKILFPQIHRVFYQDGFDIKLFKRSEIGGDSSTFNKYYPLYHHAGVLQEGHIGQAKTYLIQAKDAYAIEYKTLQNNPTFHLCTRRDCFNCQGRNLMNVKEWPAFYTRIACIILKKTIRKFIK